MSTTTVTLRITADARGVVTGVNLASREVAQFGSQARAAGVQAAAGFSAARAGVASISLQLQRLQSLAGAWAAFSGVRAVVSDMLRTADAASAVNARLKIATGSAQAYAAAQAEVRAISVEARASLESVGTLYTRLSQSAESLGYSQQKVSDITRSVAMAVSLSGGSAEAAAAGVTQLSQAFASGVLSGDEFRSVMENSPRIVKALTDSLGLTVGELRKMAEEQRLTADIVSNAITQQMEAMRKELAETPMTVGQAIGQINNSWMLYVDAVLNAGGETQALTQALGAVSDLLLLEEQAARQGAGGTEVLASALQLAVGAAVITKNAFEAVVNVLFAVVDTLRHFVGAWTGALSESIKGIRAYQDALLNLDFEGAFDALVQGQQNAESAISKSWNGIKSAWSSAGDGISDSIADVSAMFEAFGEAGKKAIQSIGTATQAADGIAPTGSERIAAILKEQTAQFDAAKKKIDEYTQGSAAYRLEQQAQALSLAAMTANGEAEVAMLKKRFAEINAAIDQASNLGKAEKDAEAAARAANSERERAAKAAANYVDSLQEEVATFGMSEAALDQYTLAHTTGLTPAMQDAAAAALAQIEANRKLKAGWDQAAQAGSSLASSNAQLREQIAQQNDKLRGLTVTQIAINAARRQAVALEAQLALAKGGLSEAMRAELQASVALVEQYENNEDILAGQADAASELDRILSGLDDIGLSGLLRDMDVLNAELAKANAATGEAFDPAKVAKLNAMLDMTQHKLVTGVVGSAQEALRGLQSMSDGGSDAFNALQIAIDALTLVQAISAVLNQGNGDPYTAFGRMAAMASVVSAVAGLSISVGGAAGGFGNVAQDRQDEQGTGSVLGDAQADSASILNATEITANATSKLVGINRSMLSALQAMQAGLSGASTLLARGAGDVDFAAPGAAPLNFATRASLAPLNILTLGLLDGLLGSITRSILGARSKITDTGLLIGGGMLSELLDGITVSAYQEVSSRSWWFGSTHTNTDTQALGDDVAAQFQLVLDSMADAVRAGAEALGLNMEEVNAAIAAYQIEEIRISTMDLSAEEAQAELEAVFGKIFDGLAGSVVPFIDQFQQVGEGLGETLVRVATGVMVTQEAVRQLGFALDETDPERFAQISEGLIEMAGGIDAFISSMGDFVNAFAPEAHKFEVAQTALNTAFAEAGLVLPDTREGMWDLMQSLDATTESGQRQIATLLRLAGTADSYYTMMESQQNELAQATEDAAAEQQALIDAQADYRDFIESILRETQQLSTYASAMRDVDEWRTDAVESANAHARAAGAAGASEQALALIEMRAAQMRAVALAQLREETQSLVDQLYGAGEADIGSAFTSGIESAGNAAADYWEQQRQSALTLQQYLDSMLLGDTSALTPAEQLSEAWAQLNEAVASGDASAATQLADVYLRLLRGTEASGDDYNSGFWQVRDLLQGMLSNVSGASGPTGDNWGGTMTAGEAAQVAETNRLELAVQLAQHLADFSGAIGQTVWELMDSMGVNLMSLTEDLGINLDTITGETVLALVNMADLLGVSLTDLTGEMGLTLSDLGDGITELTTQMGIDLTSMTVASTQSLATLANQLGVDLTELSASVGVDLGNLADSQSLLNQALQAEVAKLPTGQSTALQPYLDAITNATNEADANEAIGELSDYVNELAPNIRNQLAPYLANVFPVAAMDDLDYLSSLSTTADTQLEVAVRAADLLDRIASNTAASNSAAGVPSYAVGTWNVPATGPAILHAGEMVLPVPMANAWRNGNIGGQGSSDAAVIAELRRIADRLERLERVDAQGTEAIVTAVVTAAERSDRANDHSRGQHAAMRRGVTS